jgi:integrase
LGDLSIVGADSDPFQTYAARWLADGEGARKGSTHRFYEFNLRMYILPVIGHQPIGTITRAECRKVIAAGRAKGLKVASLYGVQRTLSAVLSQAVEDGILPANPAFRMGKHLRRGDEPRAAIHPLTHAESHHFLETVRTHWPEYYAFFLCALRAGLRLGELLGLQWGDLDFTGRFIEVQRNIVGGKVTTPKNSKRRRVDLSAKLAEALEHRHAGAKADALKTGQPLSSWVFTNRDGGPLDGDNVRKRIFEKALTKAKLHHVRVHDLRHSFASQLIQNGESLAYVKEQLGHSSIQVTVDVYGHLVPGSNRAAVDRLDEVPVRNPGATSGTESKSKKTAK